MYSKKRPLVTFLMEKDNAFMKELNYEIRVDDLQRRIIVQALSDLKDKQKSQGKQYDFIDNLILVVCDAPLTKKKNHFYEKR